jgi:L-serine/L-threonine ammonia-lyase
VLLRLERSSNIKPSPGIRSYHDMDIKTPLPWVTTPLTESRALSEAAGWYVYSLPWTNTNNLNHISRVFLKLDNLQPSGSFKSRGIGNFILQRLNTRHGSDKARTHFYAASGGNAGLACVHAAKLYGYPATVVVPSSAKPAMIDKLRTAGAAAVIQYGSNIAESQAYIERVLLPQDLGGVFVPPFDHPDIWEGNATVMREIAEQSGGAPDVVVCSVGGGGLLNGIMQAIDERAWNDKVQVLAMETIGADSLNQALRAVLGCRRKRSTMRSVRMSAV